MGFKIKRILSALEVGDRMEKGLCLLCDELYTLQHHQLMHKKARYLVREMEDEPEYEQEGSEIKFTRLLESKGDAEALNDEGQPLNIGATTAATTPPFPSDSTPLFFDPLMSDDDDTKKPQDEDKTVADPGESFCELKQSLNVAFPEQNNYHLNPKGDSVVIPVPDFVDEQMVRVPRPIPFLVRIGIPCFDLIFLVSDLPSLGKEKFLLHSFNTIHVPPPSIFISFNRFRSFDPGGPVTFSFPSRVSPSNVLPSSPVWSRISPATFGFPVMGTSPGSASRWPWVPRFFGVQNKFRVRCAMSDSESLFTGLGLHAVLGLGPSWPFLLVNGTISFSCFWSGQFLIWDAIGKAGSHFTDGGNISATMLVEVIPAMGLLFLLLLQKPGTPCFTCFCIPIEKAFITLIHHPGILDAFSVVHMLKFFSTVLLTLVMIMILNPLVTMVPLYFLVFFVVKWVYALSRLLRAETTFEFAKWNGIGLVSIRTAPKKYSCIFARLPVFELHFDLLNSIFIQEGFDQSKKGVKYLHLEIVEGSCEEEMDRIGDIWAAPYRWSCMVIAYKTNKFQKHKLAPIEDWAELWRPIAMVDPPRKVVGAVLKYMGASYNSNDINLEVNGGRDAVKHNLALHAKQVRLFDSINYLKAFGVGYVWVAVEENSEGNGESDMICQKLHDQQAVVTRVEHCKFDHPEVTKWLLFVRVHITAELQVLIIGAGKGLFEVKQIGDEFFAFIAAHKEPSACSILLRGASNGLSNEIERNIHEATSVLATEAQGYFTVIVGVYLTFDAKGFLGNLMRNISVFCFEKLSATQQERNVLFHLQGALLITSTAYHPNLEIPKVFHMPMLQLCTTTIYASAQGGKYVAVLHRKMIPRGSVQAAVFVNVCLLPRLFLLVLQWAPRVIVFHRKMIDWSRVRAPLVLIKWKALPPKHGLVGSNSLVTWLRTMKKTLLI